VDDSVAGVILNRYDERDRLVGQVTPEGTVSYGYDVASRRVRMDIPGSVAVTYGYDANSRLTDVSEAGRTAHLTYDPAGRRTSLSLPNGLVTEYGYDAASHLTSLVYRTPASVLGELTYQYDAAGHRMRIGGALAETLLPPAVASATYDAGNRQLTFGDTHTTFDANGSATSISEPSGVTGLTWDARNRLIGVSSPAATAEYTYDGFGRRITKQVGGATTRYVYDGVDNVQELTTGGPVSYLHGDTIDELLMIERPEGRFFPTADAIGSTVLLTNEAGATTARYFYEPFGTTTSTNPGFPNAFRFTGRELDETGLYYYRARYYHARLQRFASEDPLGLRAGFNFYSYVGNDPLRYTDPLGLDKQAPDNWTPLVQGGPSIILAGMDMSGGRGLHEAGTLGGEAAESIKSGVEFAGLGGLMVAAGLLTGQPVLVIVGGGVFVYGAAEFGLGLYQLNLLNSLVGPR
jgi:RHS repeat-associated protein